MTGIKFLHEGIYTVLEKQIEEKSTPIYNSMEKIPT